MKAVNAGRMTVMIAMVVGAVAASARAEEAAAAAAAPAEEPAATASASVDVVSAYIFRGGTVNDDVDVQPSLEGVFYKALTLGTWGNLNTDSSNIDEIDYYLSYALPSFGNCPVGLSVGYTEYTYPAAEHVHPAGLAAGEVSPAIEADREVNVIASYAMNPCDKSTWTTSLAGNFGIEGPFLDQGINVTADTGLSYDVTDDVSVNGGATAALELGDNYADNGFSYAQLNAGAAYKFLNAAVHYVIETDEDVLVVDEDFWGSVGMVLPL